MCVYLYLRLVFSVCSEPGRKARVMLQQYKLAEGAKLTARRLTQSASSHKTLIPEDEQKTHKNTECWALALRGGRVGDAEPQ